MAGNRSSSALVPTGLVLAGGGARGAYEVGVIRYILEELQLPSGAQPAFNIFAGTSVGALSTAFLAASCDQPRAGVRTLVEYWRSIKLDTILRFGMPELAALYALVTGKPPGKAGLSRLLSRHRPWSGKSHHPPIQGVFDTAPFAWEMHKLIPWEQIVANINDNSLLGIALVATEVCRGKTVVFYDAPKDRILNFGSDVSREARRTRIGVEHTMASSAIPFLFPSVQIDGFCFSDGGLRQNTPIAPALRLGAERLLVVGIAEAPEVAYRKARLGCMKNPNPGLLFLLGRTVNLLITEGLDYELSRLEMFNHLLARGRDLYGESFAENLNALTGKYRDDAYRSVKTLQIRPSQDLNRMAIEAGLDARHELRLPGMSGKIFEQFILSDSVLQSELLSYILFTPTYIKRLMELGYEDARNRRDELVAFFTPPSDKRTIPA